MTVIRIKQYQFELNDPFIEGHRLAANEASALNSLRAENIRNLAAPRVAAAIEASETALLSDGELTQLRLDVAALDARYQFQPKKTYRRLGLIEAEAQRLGRIAASEEAQQRGLDLSESQLDAAAAEAAKRPEILDEARRRVEEGQRLAATALEDLL